MSDLGLFVVELFANTAKNTKPLNHETIRIYHNAAFPAIILITYLSISDDNSSSKSSFKSLKSKPCKPIRSF